MTEELYEKALHRVRSEVESAAAAFYTVEELEDFAREASTNLEKLSRDANFWIVARFGMQTTYFITLGRIFDKRSDVHSIINLLALTEDHPEYFLKPALAERKRKQSPSQELSWLNEYLDQAWEPTTDELKSFRAALEPAQNKYREKYAAIRHKMFAHTEKKEGLVAKLLEGTMIADIDSILSDLNEVVLALYALYDNGRKHTFGTGSRSYVENVRYCARTALNRL